MPRFTTLYSGSSGNCAAIEADGSFLLVDMGGSCRATLGALVQAGLSPRGLAGILVTHEHSDHVKGLAVFLKKVKVPVYASAGTLQALRQEALVPEDAQLVAMDDGPVQVGCFEVRCFETSHDAAACRGWRVAAGPHVMAIATDLGEMTPAVYGHFEDAGLVALEANYDPVMLQLGRYPGYLKKRIASPVGHLSNRDAAQTVARLVACGCRQVVLCHLSAENNQPRLALQAVADAMDECGLGADATAVVRTASRYAVDEWLTF